MNSFPYMISIARKHRNLTCVQVLLASRIACMNYFACSIKHLGDITNMSHRRLYVNLNELVNQGILFSASYSTGRGNQVRNIYVCLYDANGRKRSEDEINNLLMDGIRDIKEYYSKGGIDALLDEYLNNSQ